MRYFDAHCHIQFEGYDTDRKEVLERMNDAGVGGLVVGVDLDSSKKAIEMAQENPLLVASVGLHPNDTDQPFERNIFQALAMDPQVRAIGECGLDYYRPDDPESVKKRQKDVFEQHIEIAVAADKPLMIHSRPRKGSQDAYHDTIDMIRSKQREYGERLRGNMHFFVGGVEEARQFLELGFTMSYTAVLTFTDAYDEVIRAIPLSNLLTETDSPYVAPAPNRGKRNEPVAVMAVVDAIARIKGEEKEVVRMAILQNATRLFRIS